MPGSSSTGVANVCSIEWPPDARRVSRRALPLCAQPRAGDAVRLVAEPVHGLRPPLHVLLRAGVRGARRPARRRPLRREHPGEDERRRGAPARAGPARPGSGRRSRSAPRPTRTSPPRAATGSRARASRCSARRRARSRSSRAGRSSSATSTCSPRRRAGRTSSVTFSIPTLDPEIWRTTEPGTAPPHQRLRALQELVKAGLDVGVGMAPILPGLSDRPELLAEVVRAARAAGATGVWANLLYLKPGTKEHFLAALERDWPELLPGVRAAVRAPRVSPGRGDEARARAGARARARRAASATGAGCGSSRRPIPEQLRARRLAGIGAVEVPVARDGRSPRTPSWRGSSDEARDDPLAALEVAVEDVDASGPRRASIASRAATNSARARVAERPLPEADVAGGHVDVAREAR